MSPPRAERSAATSSDCAAALRGPCRLVAVTIAISPGTVSAWQVRGATRRHTSTAPRGAENDDRPARLHHHFELRSPDADRGVGRAHLVDRRRPGAGDEAGNALRRREHDRPRSPVGIEDEAVELHRRGGADREPGLIEEAELGAACGARPDGLVLVDVVPGRDRARASGDLSRDLPLDRNRAADRLRRIPGDMRPKLRS